MHNLDINLLRHRNTVPDIPIYLSICISQTLSDPRISSLPVITQDIIIAELKKRVESDLHTQLDRNQNGKIIIPSFLQYFESNKPPNIESLASDAGVYQPTFINKIKVAEKALVRMYGLNDSESLLEKYIEVLRLKDYFDDD
jgi:hypothetical protein